jgi:hypothetical protein
LPPSPVAAVRHRQVPTRLQERFSDAGGSHARPRSAAELVSTMAASWNHQQGNSAPRMWSSEDALNRPGTSDLTGTWASASKSSPDAQNSVYKVHTVQLPGLTASGPRARVNTLATSPTKRSPEAAWIRVNFSIHAAKISGINTRYLHHDANRPRSRSSDLHANSTLTPTRVVGAVGGGAGQRWSSPLARSRKTSTHNINRRRGLLGYQSAIEPSASVPNVARRLWRVMQYAN